MSYLEKALIKKRKELEKIVRLLTENTSIEKEPKGKLRISRCRDVPQYYYCAAGDTANHNGVYIPQKDKQFASKLAQNEYDNKLLKKAQKELMLVQQMLDRYNSNDLISIYDKMHKERQSIVEPRIISEKRFRQEWEAVKYTGNEYEFKNEFYTDKGERVRSKSEKIIADMMFKMDIPYRYEYPVHLKGRGIVYPDFTVLCVSQKKEVYYEHCGKMDDEGYIHRTLSKIEDYEKNGYHLGDRLFLTFESSDYPLSTQMIRILLNRFL